MFQLSLEIDFFANYRPSDIPLFTNVVSCILLIKIQHVKQNGFLKHSLKTFKINSFSILTYIPICLALSVRWESSFSDSIMRIYLLIPKIFISALSTGFKLLVSTIIISIISYFVDTGITNLLNRNEVENT